MIQIIPIIIAGLILPTTAFAHMYFDGYGTASWLGMGFGMLIFWIIVVIFLFAIIRWAVGQGKTGYESTSQALNILKERYAKGEINKDQFESMKRDIQ